MLMCRILTRISRSLIFTRCCHQKYRNSPYFQISEEVLQALYSAKPVVALESTLLTHGLPSDRALSVASEVEAAVREGGAIPATIAVFGKKIRVGLDAYDLEKLTIASSEGNARKAALRDLPFALTSTDGNLVFGTTVSATAFAANCVGINIFATGGIGGVHRDGENTMDISSDLTALSNIPVAVISAGVKSILDIPRTLEVLESKGVCVTSVGTNVFPAFFTRNSGIRSPGRVDSPLEAANLLRTSLAIRPGSGMLIAVPIPEDMQAEGEVISKAIETALKEATEAHIVGAEITPFMLERVRVLTGNASLNANVRLVLNNARFAGEMAANFFGQSESEQVDHSPQVAVVGGSNLDTVIKLNNKRLKAAQDIYPPASYQGVVEVVGGGGVGRNIAEVLALLSVPHVFLTALGKDTYGDYLMKKYSHIRWNTIALDSERTANYIGILNATGELIFGVADMEIHEKITPQFTSERLSSYPSLKVICLDANLSIPTIREVIRVAHEARIPIWFEPTDLLKCTKISEVLSFRHPINTISPNLNEFKAIYAEACGKQLITDASIDEASLKAIKKAAHELKDVAENWLVKLGSHGVLFVNAEAAIKFTSPITDQRTIASVSGAGDSCAGAAIFLRFIRQWTWRQAIIGGLCAAELSLKYHGTISPELHPEMFEMSTLDAWASRIDVSILK